MPSRRRPHSTELTVRWTVVIPAQLAAVLEEHFFDPIHHKFRYGSRNKLLVHLLEQYVQEQNLSTISPASQARPSSGDTNG